MIEAALQGLLDRFIADYPDAPGVLLHVDRPGLCWSGSAGVRDRATDEPLRPDATFRIASVTKTYVAAAVLRLNELGELDLDDRLASHVDGGLAELLGEDRCRSIRLRHLLTHMSGLCDFAEDTNYQELTMSDLQRHWSREDQVRLAMEQCADAGEPGERFHYSDTGYVLLGAIIERLTRSNLAAGLRALLQLDQLGLTATYLESLEPAAIDAAPRACQYVDGRNTYNADPSLDLWGGGGLVSNTADMSRFFRLLCEGQVFTSPKTLSTMLEPAAEAEGAKVGMGIAGRTIGGHDIYGHGGFWGVYSGYVPGADIAVGAAVLERNRLGELATEFLPHALELAGMAENELQTK